MVFYFQNWQELIKNINFICCPKDGEIDERFQLLIDAAKALCSYLNIHKHKTPGSTMFNNNCFELHWLYGKSKFYNEHKIIETFVDSNIPVIIEKYKNIETNEYKELKVEKFDIFFDRFIFDNT